MTPTLFRLLLTVPWAGVLYASLQLHRLDLHLGHSICGPWGCGPPTEALLGYHAFWLVFIVPPAMVVGSLLPYDVRRWVGLAILAVGLTAILGYVGWDVSRYYAQTKSAAYLGQRGLFTLVTAVDLPMLQITLAGLILYVGRKRTERDRPYDRISANLSGQTESELEAASPFEEPQAVQ